MGTIIAESERHADVLMDGEGAKIWIVSKDDLIPVAKSPNVRISDGGHET